MLCTTHQKPSNMDHVDLLMMNYKVKLHNEDGKGNIILDFTYISIYV